MDDLRLAAELLGWFFAYDDQFEGPLGWDEARTARVVSASKQVFAGRLPDRSTDPFNNALTHFWEQLRQRASIELWERMVAHALGWLDGYRWETSLRVHRRIPSVAEQRRERFWTSEMSYVWEYIELTDAAFLPQRFIRHPEIQRTLADCTLIIAWGNDVCSLSRENPYNNVVYAIQQEQSCPLQHAVDRAHRMVLDLCDSLLDRYSRLPDLLAGLNLDAGEAERSQRWFHHLVLGVSGALRWHRETGRYSQEHRQSLPSLYSRADHSVRATEEPL